MGDTFDVKRTGPKSARAAGSYDTSPERLTSVIRGAIDSLPRWKIERESDGLIEAVRSTRLFKFEDDVMVKISGSGEESKVVFESASRVGKGDLGQNRRNLRELLEAVDRTVDETPD